MKPLRDWDTAPLGYEFGEQTFYGSKHLGVDHIVPTGTELYAPFDGEVVWEGSGTQGGLTIHFKTKDVVMRFMHLKEFKRGLGATREGDLIALTDNTGTATSGSHLHTDISKGSVQINNFSNFINPMDYDWGEENMGFDENQLKSIYSYAFTRMRDYFGLSKGVNEDVAFRLDETKKGSVTEVEEQFNVYIANQTKWMQTKNYNELQVKYDKLKLDDDRLKGQMADALKMIEDQRILLREDEETINTLKKQVETGCKVVEERIVWESIIIGKVKGWLKKLYAIIAKKN